MDDVSDNKSIFIKIEEGEKKVRVIGDIHDVKEHNVLIEGKRKFIACPTENVRMRISAGELDKESDVPPCPLCELGYPVKTSYLAVAVDRDEECAGVLKKGSTVLGAIQSLKDDEDWGNGEDYDVKIVATGKDLARKYAINGIPPNKSKELTEKEKTSLAKLNEETSIDQMTFPKSYDDIRKQIGEDFAEFVDESK